MVQTTPNRIRTMFGRPQGKPVFGRALTFRSAKQAPLQAFLPSTPYFANNQTTFFLPETAKRFAKSAFQRGGAVLPTDGIGGGFR